MRGVRNGVVGQYEESFHTARGGGGGGGGGEGGNEGAEEGLVVGLINESAVVIEKVVRSN